MSDEKKIPIVPIATGEVFLGDKIVDEQHCYICKREFNKFDDKDMLLIRIKKGEMGFCCSRHHGIVAEFIRQYRFIPGGWKRHDKKIEDLDIDTTIKPGFNKYRQHSRKIKKASKRRR